VHADFYSEGMMDRFSREAEGRIQELSQQNLANMAWAFGKLTHDAPPVAPPTAHCPPPTAHCPPPTAHCPLH